MEYFENIENSLDNISNDLLFSLCLEELEHAGKGHIEKNPQRFLNQRVLPSLQPGLGLQVLDLSPRLLQQQLRPHEGQGQLCSGHKHNYGTKGRCRMLTNVVFLTVFINIKFGL